LPKKEEIETPIIDFMEKLTVKAVKAVFGLSRVAAKEVKKALKGSGSPS
jgi:hypothetical protein